MTQTSTADPQNLDRLLEQDISFRKFRKHFPSRIAALQALADYHAAVHAFPSGSHCCVCGRDADFCAQFAFAAHADPSFRISRGPVSTTNVQFWAFAPFCKSCWRRNTLQRILAGLLHFVALMGGVLGFVLGSIGGFGALFAFADGELADAFSFLAVAIFSVAFIGGSFLTAKLVRRLRLPPPLRSIRPPFRFANACREKTPGKFPLGPTASG